MVSESQAVVVGVCHTTFLALSFSYPKAPTSQTAHTATLALSLALYLLTRGTTVSENNHTMQVFTLSTNTSNHPASHGNTLQHQAPAVLAGPLLWWPG